MARIQMYERRVVQNAVPNMAQASGDSPIGRALQGIGEQGSRIANGLMEEEIKERDAIAAVQVGNILSEGDVFWQQRSTEISSAWKVGDPDLRETLDKEYGKWAKDTEEKLTTPAAKRYFQQNVNRQRAQLLQAAFTYQRRATSEKLTAETAAAEDADERNVASNWRDPAALDAVIARRVETILARPDLSEADKIKEANRVKARMTLARERAYVENDPEGWLRDNPGERQKPGATPAELKPAPVAAAPAAGGAPDSVWSALIRQESGGKQFAKDGTPLTSKKGAIGIAQVMPGTGPEAAKLAGLPWDERRYRQDQGYNEALGKAYFEAQLKRFGGDVPKALAAYNAGPGRVDALVKKHGENWLQFAPAETRQYVAAITKRAGSAPATAAAPAAPAPQPGVQVASTEPVELPPLSRTAARLDPDAVYQLRNLATTRVNQTTAQARAELERTVSDLMAAHKDGKVEATALTAEAFAKALGPEAGGRAFESYQRSREMGMDIAGFATMPAAEIAATVERSRPTEAGPGYAAADARAQVRAQAAAAVIRQREADPVTYAAKTSPAVKQAADAVANLPAGAGIDERRAAQDRYITASLAEQARLGIAQPRILSPQQADRWAAMAQAATRPEDSANLIAGLEAEYGNNFPRVFAELVQAGKLSNEYLIIPNLPTQVGRENVSRLARVKESDLLEGVPTDQQRVIKDGVTEAMAEFVRQVPVMGDRSIATANAYAQTMRKIAYERVAAGVPAADAVQQARQMLLGHYRFDGTLRYPATVNASAADRGMDLALESLTDIDVPPDMRGGRTPDEARAVFVQMLKTRPMWHTSDDDGGVQLWVQRDDGTKLRVTRGGKPVGWSWDELVAMDVGKKADSRAAMFGPKPGETIVTPADVDRALRSGNMREYERLKAEQRRQELRRQNEAIRKQ